MRYVALACDYDGTLATAGKVAPRTLEALRRLRASGRKLILVTGRLLSELEDVFPHLDLFERVVAENGAVLFRPRTRETRVLASPPPPAFLRALRRKRVPQLSAGRVIVAAFRPHETEMLEAIRDLGLETHLIFNKDAVMALPSGVNKATGLEAALAELSLSHHNCVGVGDGENDHAFLEDCECGVALGNAVPMLRREADFTMRARNGEGTRALMDRILAEDLARHEPARRRIAIARADDGRPLTLKPYGPRILLVGQSGGGKSSVALALVERLIAARYQVCVVDPEGDYESLGGALMLGDSDNPPNLEEAVRYLSDPGANAVLNLLEIPPEDRPAFFDSLAVRLTEPCARLGHPHWLVVDEAHHVLPADKAPSPSAFPAGFGGALLITLTPDALPAWALREIDCLFVVGPEPEKALKTFAAARGLSLPRRAWPELPKRRAYVWEVGARPPFVASFPRHRSEKRRHRRKYAEGDLGPKESFYFRGPDKRLKLQAQNLSTFLRMADGVDDATWTHHLRRGDYSRWFRAAIKDEKLARRAAAIERSRLGPSASRDRIRGLIEERYTAPAPPPRASAGALSSRSARSSRRARRGLKARAGA